MILRSDEPQSRKYEFLNGVLDLAEQYNGAEALYTVNGIASMIPHTATRRVFLVSNDPVLQRELRRWPGGLAWQGPPHTSIYLLWLARNRHLPGVGLWVEVPFYLVDSEDFQAIKTGVSLLGRILGWQYDLDDLDQRIAEQDETLAQLREQDPEIDTKIRILEQGETLDGNEQRELVEAVQGALKEQSRDWACRRHFVRLPPRSSDEWKILAKRLALAATLLKYGFYCLGERQASGD